MSCTANTSAPETPALRSGLEPAINDDDANEDTYYRRRYAASDQYHAAGSKLWFRTVAAPTSFPGFHGISDLVTIEDPELPPRRGSSQ